MKKNAVIIGTIFLLASAASTSVSGKDLNEAVKKNIKKVAGTVHGKTGVAVLGLDFTDTMNLNGYKYFPMQSVYKFPLAMFILHKVDKGQLSLSQSINIAKGTLDKETWSPMLKDYPDQDIEISLADLLRYCVSKSDNNACDVLFWLAGGTQATSDYIHSLGITGIDIAATEAEMHKVLSTQYNNRSQPVAMAKLLQLLFDGNTLSKKSNALLMDMMTRSENSPNRIMGLLPKNTVVAHKTGTSYTEKGITAATNDVGIVTLPNGKHYALVVYVSDFRGNPETGEKTISELSKVIWDNYTGNK